MLLDSAIGIRVFSQIDVFNCMLVAWLRCVT